MVRPLAAACAAHGVIAALILAIPPRRLPSAPEPHAVTVIAADAPPSPAPWVVAADLDEPAPPGPVAWPETSPAPAPRAAAPRLLRAPPVPAAAPAPSASPAVSSAPPSADALAAWRAALSDWIERHRRYPPAARFREEEGVVHLRFHLDPAGRVMHVVLEAGSGSAILDAAALSLLTGATLPAPPPGLSPAQRSVSVPIRYRLQ
jgi:protein TonB